MAAAVRTVHSVGVVKGGGGGWRQGSSSCVMWHLWAGIQQGSKGLLLPPWPGGGNSPPASFTSETLAAEWRLERPQAGSSGGSGH
jgi:hypothetical protein